MYFQQIGLSVEFIDKIEKAKSFSTAREAEFWESFIQRRFPQTPQRVLNIVPHNEGFVIQLVQC